MTSNLAIYCADQVERINDDGNHVVWSVRLSDADAEQRQRLIDHHDQVRQLLERRGRRVRSGVVVRKDGNQRGEFLTLRVSPGPWRIHV